MEQPDRAGSPSEGGRFGRAVRFGIVGVIGVVVNEGVLVGLHGGTGLPLALASPIAIEASILGNFLLNSHWTWRYDFRRSLALWLRKALQYHASAAVAAFIGNYGILLALVHGMGIDYRLANLVGIAAGSAVNYIASEFWIFRRRDAGDQGRDGDTGGE